MKTMSKEESMLSDLEMSAKSLERCIKFFYENGDKNISAYTNSGKEIADIITKIFKIFQNRI
jgi:hypothetical protein